MARPTKRTKSAEARIVEAISLGATYQRAAAAGGIAYRTLRDWLSDAEAQGEASAFAQFAQAVKEAEASCVAECLQSIRTAHKEGTWQASAWLLERRYPEEYGRREVTKHEHSGPNGGAISFSFGAVVAELAVGSDPDREDAGEG